uniref:Capsid protein n=1 Tax=Torque teno calomys tener virus TaxID=2054616 RepID=A0A2H4QBC4_9VIRU|nr:putative ORF1 [Torque teno calomys tener virus]
MARAYKWKPSRWRKRRWRRPRRTYRRRPFSRGKRTRRPRRRHLRVRALYEVQPRFQRKCTIRGVFCPLILGNELANANTYQSVWHGFNPVRRFGIWGNNNSNVQLGGWVVGHFSLQMLYYEHKDWKNRWSNTNCGWDLVQYYGTTLFLEQHKDQDYIVFLDPEYQSTEEFLKTTSIHPLLMITHPNTILIKSRERAGPRRARKVFLPRPSWWDSGWSFSTDICKKGIFLFYVCFIDLDWPWLDNYIEDHKKEKAKWWKDNKWKEEFDKYVKDNFMMPTQDTDIHETLNMGPFWPRPVDVNNSKNLQLVFFYKSYWRWGGNNLTVKAVCDPCNVLPS